jgi:hypothetical protein
MLKHVLSLRLETNVHECQKGKFVAKHNDEKWLWDLAMLCDISHQLNYLNTKLQGQQKLTSGMSETVSFLNKAETTLGKAGKMLTYVIFLPMICFIRLHQ